MTRRKYVPEQKIDPEVTQTPTIDLNTLEIKGRDDKWKVFYPDDQNIPTPVPIYDLDGKLVEVVRSQVATDKMIEAHETFTSLEKAKDYAEFLHPGCTIKITRTSKREEALAKAREVKKKKKEVENDD